MPDGKVSIRARDVTFRDDLGSVETRQNGVVVFSQQKRLKTAGRQLTVSEGHPWPRKRTAILSDVGGDFYTVKRYIQEDRVNSYQPLVSLKVGNPRIGFYESYVGPLYPIRPDNANNYPPAVTMDNTRLLAYGGTAISRCKPTNSVSGLAVALGELKREGIPKLVGSQGWAARSKSLREKSRAAGSEYLNVQFGWLPLVRDVIDVAKAAEMSEKIISQYKKDDGKLVRRRYEFPLVEEFTEPKISDTNVWPYTNSSVDFRTFGSKPGTLYVTKKKVIRRYFSGAFTYHIPTRQGALGKVAQDAAFARKLYGLTLDPEVLWSLTPWSWAVDWFANVGDILSTASDAVTDGLVMPYGYMMEHTIETHTYEIRGLALSSRNVPPPISFVTETKKRVAASPYGFGLTWDGFSPYQLSILAALGLTRGGRT